jgi:hypothetical protein
MDTQVYRVQAPDGTIVRIQGPVGASEEEVIAQAQALYQQEPSVQQTEQPAPTPSRLMSLFEPSTQRIIQGSVIDPINAVRQMISPEQRELVSQQEKEYQAVRKTQGSTGFDWFRLVGNILSPATLAAGAKAGTALQSAGVTSKVGIGAGMAAGTQVVLPTAGENITADDYWLQKVKDVGFSGAAGGVFAKIAGALTPTLQPGVREQLEAGVKVPAGEAYGGAPGWLFRQLESIGVAGPGEKVIRQSFTKSAGDEVLSSLGKKVPSNIKEGMQMSGFIQKEISKYYDDTFSQLGKIIPDNQFADDLSGILLQKQQEMPNNVFKRFATDLQDNVIKKYKVGPTTTGAVAKQGQKQIPVIDGDDLKSLKNHIKTKIETYTTGKAKDTESYRLLAGAYEDSLNAVNSYISRVDTTGRIAKADEAWSKLYRFADASGLASKFQGNFTPEQLAQASKSQTTTLQGGAAQGPMQEFAQEGIRVLGDRNFPGPIRANFRSGIVVSKLLGGTALWAYNPAVLTPLFLASGLSYKAATRLMSNPSAMRVAIEKAVQKVGPSVAASLITQAALENGVPQEELE